MSMQLKPFTYAGLSLEQTMIDLAVRFILNCPPEDLSTPVRLMFQVEEAHWFYSDFSRAENDESPIFKLKAFAQKLYQVVPVMKSIYADPLAAVTKFSNYKREIPVRGGIISNEAMDKVLLVRAWKCKSWGFPRGKINKGEDDLVCAIREVYEETGFDMTPYTNRNEYAKKTIQGKNFLLYFASGVPESTEFVTKTREEIEEIKWIPSAEVISKPIYKTFLVPPFLRDIERFISKRYRRQKAAARKKNAAAADVHATNLSEQGSTALKQSLGIPATSSAVPRDHDTSSEHLLKMIQGGQSSGRNGTAVSTELTVPSVAPTEAHLPVLTGDNGTPGFVGMQNPLQQIMPTGLPIQPTHAAAQETAPAHAASTAQHPRQDLRGSDMESAKHILALLNREIVSEDAKASSPEALDLDETEAPSLPQNDMLEQLVSSRRSRQIRHESKVPTKKPKLKQNSLLQVSISSNYTKHNKLIDLLKPASDENKTKRASFRSEHSLMKLLEESGADTSTDAPINDNKLSKEKTRSAEVPGIELMKLLCEPAVNKPAVPTLSESELNKDIAAEHAQAEQEETKEPEVPMKRGLSSLLSASHISTPSSNHVEASKPQMDLTLDEVPSGEERTRTESMDTCEKDVFNKIDESFPNIVPKPHSKASSKPSKPSRAPVPVDASSTSETEKNPQPQPVKISLLDLLGDQHIVNKAPSEILASAHTAVDINSKNVDKANATQDKKLLAKPRQSLMSLLTEQGANEHEAQNTNVSFEGIYREEREKEKSNACDVSVKEKPTTNPSLLSMLIGDNHEPSNSASNLNIEGSAKSAKPNFLLSLSEQ